jgi:hypothetical protein
MTVSIRVLCFLLGIGAVWAHCRLRRATLGPEPLYATDAINMKHADYWTRR